MPVYLYVQISYVMMSYICFIFDSAATVMLYQSIWCRPVGPLWYLSRPFGGFWQHILISWLLLVTGVQQ